MRIILPFILNISILLAFMGCRPSHKKDAPSILQQVESAMIVQPDSALYWLQSIQSVEQWSDESRAWYALLLVRAQYKNHQPVENDSLLQTAYQYYSHTSDSLRKAWTCFYLAQIYRDMNLKEKALSFFFQADRAGKNIENYEFKYLLYYHWGNLFANEAVFTESMDKHKMALQHADFLNDTTKQILALGVLSWDYIGAKEYQQAYRYLYKGIELSSLEYPDLLPWLYHNLAMAYKQDEKPREALKYINLCLKTEEKNAREFNIYISTKGDIFMDLQQYDSAQHYYEKDKSYTTYVEKGAHHLSWSELEEAVGNYKEALRHRKLYDTYLDSIYEEGADKQMRNLQKRYDYVTVKMENGELKIEQQHSRMFVLFISLLLIASLLLTGGVYILYNRTKRAKEEALRSKESLTKNMEISMLENQIALQHTREKTAEEMEKWLEEKEALRQDYSLQHQEMVEEIMKSNELISKIRKLSEKTAKESILNANPLSEKELENLVATVNLCHNHFAERLQIGYPKLTQPDIHLCSLMCLSIPEWSILYLLNIGKVALRKRKSRLKCEKLELQEGDSLEDFLHAY